MLYLIMSNNGDETVPQLKRQAKIYPFAINGRPVKDCDLEYDEEISRIIDYIVNKEQDSAHAKCTDLSPDEKK
jgi:hypothetical protein